MGRPTEFCASQDVRRCPGRPFLVLHFRDFMRLVKTVRRVGTRLEALLQCRSRLATRTSAMELSNGSRSRHDLGTLMCRRAERSGCVRRTRMTTRTSAIPVPDAACGRGRCPPESVAVTCTDAALAVVLRQLQWALDSVARDVASLTTVRAEELAMLLEE